MSNRPTVGSPYSLAAAAELARQRRQDAGRVQEIEAQNDPALARRLPKSVMLNGLYGEGRIVPVVFGAAGSILALPRPSNWRVSLLIVNPPVVGPLATINYSWDVAADAVTGIPIQANQNRLFDFTVPQNDLYIFSPAAGTVLVEYLNVDIDRP